MKENILLHQNEEITPIQGYEGLYSITSFGRVWSHRRFNHNRWYGNYFLKLNKNKYGYIQAHLCKEGYGNYISVHKLVAQAYIPNPDNLPEVNHKDTDKSNNYAGITAKGYIDGNLEWCTSQMNQNHALINGLKKKHTSQYYGVYFHKNLKQTKKWIAQVTHNHKRIRIGNFLTEIEAVKAYNNYVLEHNLNRPLNVI